MLSCFWWQNKFTFAVNITHAFANFCCIFFSLDSQFRSLDTLYTKPYTRIGAYFAGVWTGFYLSKVNRNWCVRKVSNLSLHCNESISVSLRAFSHFSCRARRVLHRSLLCQLLCSWCSFNAIESPTASGCRCCFQL